MARLPVGKKSRAPLPATLPARGRWWVGRHGLVTVQRRLHPKRELSQCTGLLRFVGTDRTERTDRKDRTERTERTEQHTS
mmetsp:Transcript_10734/g.29846  ORF Transcript_10734/g.29846 Transcript_10734/m.29846 type:complete len:80 (-) Transcript_10734:1418-1657(-)